MESAPVKNTFIHFSAPQSLRRNSSAPPNLLKVRKTGTKVSMSPERRLSPRHHEATGNGKVKRPAKLSEQQREAKAVDFVSKLKHTDGYRAYRTARELGHIDALAVPRTPDPALRKQSKRKWERETMKFRTALRRWGTVTVNLDEE
jgi:hypothetical protein